MDILIPGRAGSCFSSHRLATLQTRGGLPVHRPLCHHGDVTVVKGCTRDAGRPVYVRSGDVVRRGVLHIHLQHGGVEALSESHLILPDGTTSGLHGGLSAGSGAGVFRTALLQKYSCIHTGSNLHCMDHLNPSSIAQDKYVLPPKAKRWRRG